MPRKRRTKVVSSATARSGDESSNSSSSEDKQQNIELYLKDFDMRVANYIAQARTEATAMCNAIKQAFMLELMKLPKNIQQMTKAEFIANGGSINGTVMQQVSEVTNSLASSIATKNLAATQPSTAASPPASDAEGTKEKTAREATATKKKGVKGRKRATTATTTKRSTRTKSVLTDNQEMNTTQENAEPQTLRRSTRKTTRNQFVTPAANKGKVGALRSGWDTPMITPKFDPRLPVTPATCVMRNAKRGETIISLSGSPINVPTWRDHSKPEAIIPLGDGRELTVGVLSPQVDMTINETTRKNMLLLQSNLAKILKNCPVKEDGY